MNRNKYVLITIIPLIIGLIILFLSKPMNIINNSHANNYYFFNEEETIRVGGDIFLPPFSFQDNNNNLTGFSIDILNAIGKKIGINFSYTPMNLYQAEQSLKNNNIDLILGLEYSLESEKKFSLSDYYFNIPYVLVVSNENKIIELSDLRNKVVSIVDEPSLFNLLQNIRHVELLVSPNAYSALYMVKIGRADAYLGNKYPIKYYMQDLAMENDYHLINVPIYNNELVFATVKEKEGLINKLNQGLTLIKQDGTYETIYARWFNNNLPYNLTKLKLYINLLILFLIILFAFLLVSYIWNKRLNKLVMAKTSDLQKINKTLEQQKYQIYLTNLFKETILYYLPNGIATFDNLLNLTYYNPQINKITEENKQFLYLILKKFIFLTPFKLKDNLAENNYMKETAWFNITISNTKFLEINLFTFFQNNRQTGLMLTIQDRTHEKFLQEELTKKEKLHALAQLSAGLAHEIRNPLSSIKTFIELLPQNYNDQEFREEISKYLPNELQRINNLIEKLVNYAKPSSPNKDLFEVYTFIDNLLLLFKHIWEKEKIKLIKEIDSCQIFANQQQLTQIFINLLLNAIEAIKMKGNNAEDKKIIIRIKCKKDLTIITIQDNGIGMKEHELNHLFEPFFTTKNNGVGLGLFIIYQLVKENNGIIRITSKEQIGTRVELKFPNNIMLTHGEKEG